MPCASGEVGNHPESLYIPMVNLMPSFSPNTAQRNLGKILTRLLLALGFIEPIIDKIIIIAIILIFLAPASKANADGQRFYELPEPKVPASTMVTPGPLQISLSVVTKNGSRRSFIEIINKSNEFVCIDRSQIDYEIIDFVIKDAKGFRASIKTFGREQGPGQHLFGFNYSSSYVFIFPNEKRKIETSIEHYELSVGKYFYEFFVVYYPCKEIIDVVRIKNKVEISAWISDAQGNINIK